MPRTLGYHLVKSAYGLWLPGDDRGSWSDAWDAQIGFCEPHQLNPGDPVRLRMAAGRDIDATARWLADQTTKAVHRHTPHTGPVWAKGCWRSFIFDPAYWAAVEQYIRNHNVRRGLPPDIF